MRTTILRMLCVLGTGILGIPQMSFATVRPFTGCVVPVAMASSINPNYLWLTTAADAQCNYVLYFDPEDKEMFATALTAVMNKKVVQVYYENAAPQVTYTEAGQVTTCKVRRINIDYYQSGAPCPGY